MSDVYEGMVTYEVLPPRGPIDSAALLCMMKGHKVNLADDHTSVFCLECGYGLQVTHTFKNAAQTDDGTADPLPPAAPSSSPEPE